MTDEQLTNLALLTIEKDLTMILSFEDVINFLVVIGGLFLHKYINYCGEIRLNKLYLHVWNFGLRSLQNASQSTKN